MGRAVWSPPGFIPDRHQSLKVQAVVVWNFFLFRSKSLENIVAYLKLGQIQELVVHTGKYPAVQYVPVFDTTLDPLEAVSSVWLAQQCHDHVICGPYCDIPLHQAEYRPGQTFFASAHACMCAAHRLQM